MGDSLRCQLHGKLAVLSKGILSKTWQKRFCVFFVELDGSSPQIHVYDKVEHYEKQSKDRKVFNLEGIKKLQFTREKYGFDVITKKDKFSFAAEDNHDLRLWVRTLKGELNITTILEADGTPASDEEESDSHLYMDDNVIYESAEVTPMFSVTINKNEAAERCELEGDYLLAVNQHNLALVDCNTKKAIFQWPFRYIRRFGKTRTNFQFEAGRKCPSGEGEFSFFTDEGFKIFEAFTKTTQKIKSLEDEPITNQLKSSGHHRAKSDGHNSKQSSVLRSSGQHSPTPVMRGISEVHHPITGGHTERRSVKSGGHVAQIPDTLASELKSALKQHQEEPGSVSINPTSSEALKDSGKKDAEKTRGEKDKKRLKKEKEMEEKAREKQEKAKQKLEKEKEKDKKSKKKKSEAPTSHPRAPSHMYEEVDDIPARQISASGPEALYAEAVDTASKAMPKAKPRKTGNTDTYSEPEKLKKDAWKQHGREEQESEHQEDYDQIRVAASKQRDSMIDPRPVIDEAPDETYDHIGNICPKRNAQESIYGTGSAKTIASIKKEKADMYNYEEAVPKSNPKKPAQVDAYEEPELLNLPADGEEEEESAYAAIN